MSELPKTLFPNGVIVSLGEFNPVELESLAARPQTVKEMPAHWDEAKRRQMAGLAQYGGRTPEGNKRSLANLPRKIKMELPENDVPDASTTLPEGVIIPVPPTMLPKVPARQTIRGKYLRRICSQEEARLFEEVYTKWINAHPEYDLPEDEDDLIDICTETVIMYRLQSVQRQNPSVDIGEAYNASYKRKQTARENLGARRKDRIDAKKNPQNKNVVNVAVMSGEYSPEKMQRQQLEEQRREEEDLNAFLDNTVEKAKKEDDL